MAWFKPPDRKNVNSLLGDLAGQNQPAKSVAYSSLPNDPYTPYLQQAQPIRRSGRSRLSRCRK